ncbi:MAG TPA: elongation factor P [Chitinophagales bacterium]|nr:elongation factor P [Chitinophagales bacterium]
MADFRNGMCIRFNNDIYQVVEFLHVKPGKGAAFVRTKLKSISTGKVLENTFPSNHKIDEVRVERRRYQYLYREDDIFHFMNNETFEQIGIPENIINNPALLLEGMDCEITFEADEEIPMTCELPLTVVQEVTYTEPGVRGDTATNALKPSTVESGAQIMVPLFIDTGEKIKINTADNSYVERAK